MCVARGVLTKTKLTQLAAQIDPKQVLDEDVQDVRNLVVLAFVILLTIFKKNLGLE